MNTSSDVNDTGCCPKFDPTPWHEKIIEWDNKLFVKDRVRCLRELKFQIIYVCQIILQNGI
jgi:hypothetical protein